MFFMLVIVPVGALCCIGFILAMWAQYHMAPHRRGKRMMDNVHKQLKIMSEIHEKEMRRNGR